MFFSISLPFPVWTWTGHVSLGQLFFHTYFTKTFYYKDKYERALNLKIFFPVVIEMVCFIEFVNEVMHIDFDVNISFLE